MILSHLVYHYQPGPIYIYQDTDVAIRISELQTFHEAGLTPYTDSKNCGSIRAKVDLDVTLPPFQIKPMTHKSDKLQRHSIRLRDYDYSQAGAYFITMCTHKKKCILGDVINGEMQLNDYGRLVEAEWIKTANIRDNIELDAFVVMPNHFHGILTIVDNCRGTVHRAPTLERFGKPTSGSLPTIVRYFKSVVTRRINELRSTPNTPIWHRNYYEHVIRNEDDLAEIREYITNNPQKWDLDSENPNNEGRLGGHAPIHCG